jgi:tetratricopeptide (TPR) repeat protein
VSLFKRFKITRELTRLEKKAKDDPSPSIFVDLAQVYINLGSQEDALRVVEEGLVLFPRSDELRKVLGFAKKQVLAKKIEHLRGDLSKKPSPALFIKLAQAYLGQGDEDSAFAVCRECLKRYPEDLESRLFLAEMATRAFQKTLKVEKGKEAHMVLLEILERDERNKKAHQELAQLFFGIGYLEGSQHHLSILRSLGRIDKESRDLEQEIKRALDEGTPSFDDPGTALMEVEKRGGLIHGKKKGAGSTKRILGSEEALNGVREGLSKLVAREGVIKAAYIRGSKALVKGEVRDGRDPFLKTARVFAKVAQRTVRRMDLGNFSKGILDGVFGHICICSFGDVCAAVQCQGNADLDWVLQDLQDLVAKSLYTVGKK